MQTRSIGKPFFSHDLYPTLRVTAWCCISVTLFFALIWRYISPFTSHVECNTEPSDIQVTCRIFPVFFAIFTLASFILMRSLCQCTATKNKTKGDCIVIYTRIPHPFCYILCLSLLPYSYVSQVHSPKIQNPLNEQFQWLVPSGFPVLAYVSSSIPSLAIIGQSSKPTK